MVKEMEHAADGVCWAGKALWEGIGQANPGKMAPNDLTMGIYVGNYSPL